MTAPGRNRPRAALSDVAYYGGLLALLTLILIKAIAHVLPGGIAAHVSRNSEGLLVVLVISAGIQFLRPRVTPSVRWRVAAVAAAGWAVIGCVLRFAPLPSQVQTLNEAAFALVLLLPYVLLPRPLQSWAWLLPIGAVVIPAVAGSTSIVTDLAETFGALVLIPLCVDLVDGGILDGSAVPLRRVLLWMAFLVVVVLVLQASFDPNPTGLIDQVLRYVSRVIEMFLAAVLLHGFFSVLRPELRLAQPSPDVVPIEGRQPVDRRTSTD